MKHTKELQAKKKDELKKMLREARDELLTLQLDNTRRKLNNTRGIFHKRKHIARILTKIKEQEGEAGK